MSASFTALNESVVGPADEPEPSAVALESHDTATSAQALLSSDVALDGAIDVAGIDAGPPASGERAMATEPAAIEPPPPAQDVDVLVSPALAALQPPPYVEDVPIVLAAQPHKATPFVPTDLAAAGATLQAFLLNEGLAAFAHWRALTRAPSPAEALRLHVGEMQRAADASITCMGRIAGHLGRIAATKAA